MPAMSPSDQSAAETLRGLITAAKVACVQVQNQCVTMQDTARGVGTTAALRAANDLARLQAAAQQAEAILRIGHADAADAILDYDPTTGAVVIQGGSRR